MQYLLKKKNMKKSMILIAFLFLFLSNRLYANDWIQKNGYLENANPIQGSVDSVIKSQDEKYLFVFSGTNIYKWEIESGALIKTYPMKFKDGYTTKYSKDMMTYSMALTANNYLNAEIYDLESDTIVCLLSNNKFYIEGSIDNNSINSDYNSNSNCFTFCYYASYSYPTGNPAEFCNGKAGFLKRFIYYPNQSKFIDTIVYSTTKDFGYIRQFLNLPNNNILALSSYEYSCYDYHNHTSRYGSYTGISLLDISYQTILNYQQFLSMLSKYSNDVNYFSTISGNNIQIYNLKKNQIMGYYSCDDHVFLKNDLFAYISLDTNLALANINNNYTFDKTYIDTVGYKKIEAFQDTLFVLAGNYLPLRIYSPKILNTPLYIFASLDSNSYYLGDTVQFKLSESSIAKTYHWDFGDGDTSNIAEPKHVYKTNGDFTAIITVKANGETISDTLKIRVIKLICNYMNDKSEGSAPLIVQFTDLSEGNPETYYWDFGDGSHSSEKNPLHTFDSTGYYHVKEVVKSRQYGDSLIKYFLIRVGISYLDTVVNNNYCMIGNYFIKKDNFWSEYNDLGDFKVFNGKKYLTRNCNLSTIYVDNPMSRLYFDHYYNSNYYILNVNFKTIKSEAIYYFQTMSFGGTHSGADPYYNDYILPNGFVGDSNNNVYLISDSSHFGMGFDDSDVQPRKLEIKKFINDSAVTIFKDTCTLTRQTTYLGGKFNSKNELVYAMNSQSYCHFNVLDIDNKNYIFKSPWEYGFIEDIALYKSYYVLTLLDHSLVTLYNKKYEKKWTINFKDSYNASINAIASVQNIILAAGSRNNVGYLVALDSLGNILWERYKGNTGWTSFYSMETASDSLIFLTGPAYNDPGYLVYNIKGDLVSEVKYRANTLFYPKYLNLDYVNNEVNIAYSTTNNIYLKALPVFNLQLSKNSIIPFTSLFEKDTVKQDSSKIIPKAGQITLGPNPADNSAIISYIFVEKQNIDVIIYNSYGEEIKKVFSGIAEKGVFEMNIDISGIPNGYYYLAIKTDNKIINEPIVIYR